MNTGIARPISAKALTAPSNRDAEPHHEPAGRQLQRGRHPGQQQLADPDPVADRHTEVAGQRTAQPAHVLLVPRQVEAVAMLDVRDQFRIGMHTEHGLDRAARDELHIGEDEQRRAEEQRHEEHQAVHYVTPHGEPPC
jgi:hypothetical protein